MSGKPTAEKRKRAKPTRPRPTNTLRARATKEAKKLAGSLSLLAERYGYQPGECAVVRAAEIQHRIEGWRECLDSGMVPPDLAGMALEDAESVYAREAADLAGFELKWLDYFYPKLKSVEAKTEHSGSISLLDAVQNRNAGLPRGGDPAIEDD